MAAARGSAIPVDAVVVAMSAVEDAADDEEHDQDRYQPATMEWPVTKPPRTRTATTTRGSSRDAAGPRGRSAWREANGGHGARGTRGSGPGGAWPPACAAGR